MGFDVNVAAARLNVDPSRITPSADGRTFTVTSNGVTKTYVASGDGDTSIFNEQVSSSGGSSPGQSVFSAGNLQSDFIMNADLMAGMMGMVDGMMNMQMPIMQMPQMPALPQMPTMPTMPTLPTSPTDNAQSAKQQFIEEHHLVEGKGKNSALKGIYYVDENGNGKISDEEAASGECYVWDDDEGEFVKYTKSGSNYKREDSNDDYELVTSTSGEVTSGSFKKMGVRRADSAKVRQVQDEAREAINSIIDGFDDTTWWGGGWTDKDDVEAGASKANKDNIMYIIEGYAKQRGSTDMAQLFKDMDDETDMFDAPYDWFYSHVSEALKQHAYDIANQTGNSSLKDTADDVFRKVRDTSNDGTRTTELMRLYNAIKDIEGDLPTA